MQTDWDTIIIGAGPAGSLAAYRLASSGHSVLLIDKAQRGRPKVCGGCLGAVGLGALAEARLPLEAISVDGSPLSTLTIHNRQRRVQLPLARRQAIARDQFDERLLAIAERAGAYVVSETRARIGAVEGIWRTVHIDAQLVRASVVLVAGGLGSQRLLPATEQSPTRVERTSRLGAGTTLSKASHDHPRGQVTMVCGRLEQGYVGLATLPDGRLDVAAALGSSALGSGENRLARLATEILSENDVTVPSTLETSDWHSTPRLTQRPTRLGAERVFLIGDAAGYVEPFTGEGIGWALRSALAVEPIAAAAIAHWHPSLLDEWAATHARVIGRKQRWCRTVCRTIGSRRMTPTIVRTLQFAPWMARPVLRLIDPVGS